MRILLFPALILAAPCAAREPTQLGEVAVPVHIAHLPLETASGRAALRERIAVAVRDFCRQHRRDVTPDALRTDRFYCEDRVRRAILTDMPRPSREAYRQAMREAGVRGRRL